MARHRSPRGRHACQSPPHGAATGRRQDATRHAAPPVPLPLRRGAAAVAVTGGALSLVAAATPGPAAAGGGAVQRVAESDPVLLLAAVEPVAPAPEVLDAAELVKAVQLAEQRFAAAEAEREAAGERAAAERAAAERAAAAARGCGLNTAGLGAVKPWVRDAAQFLGCLFGRPSMHGVAGRGGPSDHPSGRALDFMVDRATGDRLAACALRNKDALGITYVIWRQRINDGGGWTAMEDRGGVTANHEDHVHVSFRTSAGGGNPVGC